MLLRRKGKVINPSSNEESSFDDELFKDDNITKNWFMTLKRDDLKLYKSNISAKLYQRVLFSNKPANFTEIQGSLAYYKKTPELSPSKGEYRKNSERRSRSPSVAADDVEEGKGKSKSRTVMKLPFLSAILNSKKPLQLT